MHDRSPQRRRLRRVAALLALLVVPAAALAEEFTFAVQPILPPAETREAFEPLVKYLDRTIGDEHRIRLVTAQNFLTYWETMKQGEYDLVLDAAHFTDFRVARMDYEPLAKVLDVVSYTLVTGPDTFILDPVELVAKPIATISSPSLGAVRLAQLFPNPLRQPIIVEAANSQEAVNRVLEGEAVAAVIPTPLVQNYRDLNVVLTTEQVPHIALSAAPEVPEAARRRISQGLINAEQRPGGAAMLEAVNFPGFEPATPGLYAGYSDLLAGVWGY
ncbi:MAG: phosphate/phosphite/phosphonate ABC transporter substrate-binding protein [Gammaproteobacteria bacterium]|nr:phosphate/phosphite/phosphonate ABC transporter substrate-binding protein [Gammaproteobacteria bacterium]